MEYRNFDLWIEDWGTEGYPLRASCESLGEARGHLVLNTSSIQSYLDKLAFNDTSQDLLIELGMLLHDSLFTGDIGSLLQLGLGRTREREDQGLRIRLRIDSPQLSTLPWEYMYSPRQAYFVGASIKTPLVRYLEMFQPVFPLKVALPLKLLVVAPHGAGLDPQEEKDTMTEALGKLEDAVRLEFLVGNVTRAALSDALLQDRYHVIHFSGHGTFEDDQGSLLLSGEDGEPDWISDRVFARIFLDAPSVKLIVLNACEGGRTSSSSSMVGMAPRLVERGIPAVIAHQYAVVNKAAIRFAREFYRSLCAGTEPGYVDAAVARARNQLSIHFPTKRSLGAPVLFMRAPDGRIFDLPAQEPSTVSLPVPEPRVLSSEDREYLENLLAIHQRNRRILEAKTAKMGIHTPPYMIAELEDEIASIKEIQHKLGLA